MTKQILRIPNEVGPGFFDLRHVLDALSGRAQTLLWTVLHLDGVFRRGVAAARWKLPKGDDDLLRLTWDQLCELAGELEQVTDGVIVGSESFPIGVSRHDSLLCLAKACEVVIESFDSTYWQIATSDIKTQEELRKRYPRLHDVSEDESLTGMAS